MEEITPLYLCSHCDLRNLPVFANHCLYEDGENRWHRHNDFYELVIVFGGSARSQTGENFQLVHNNQMFILPPGGIHHYSHMKKFDHYNVIFSQEMLSLCHIALDDFSLLKNVGTRKEAEIYTLNDETLGTIVNIIEDIRHEAIVQLPYYILRVTSAFAQLLIILERAIRFSATDRSNLTFHIANLIRYMEDNSTKPLNLTELANRSNISESAFRHYFKRIVGTSPIDYLIRIRLKKALLLLSAGMSVQQAGHTVGFSDYNYFSRQFKKNLGLKPTEFKKLNREKHLSAHDLIAQLNQYPV